MSQYSWDTCPSTTKTQVQHFTNEVAESLAENLIGVYLHGSLAMGCFNPTCSDLDILVITAQGMTVDGKRHLAEVLLRTSNAPHPIEISFLPLAYCVPWQYPTPFDLHYGETWRERTQADLQSEGWQHWNAHVPTDPDLAAHITVTKRRGICLTGAPIAQVFPDVPSEDYRTSIVADVQDAFDWITGNPVYAILNACRVYAFLRDDLVCSKQEGGAWALNVLPDELRAVVTNALAEYADDRPVAQFDPDGIVRFVSYMRQRIG